MIRTTWKTIFWSQFAATIDMLDNSLKACPDELWTAVLWDDPEMPPGFSQFWYTAYHTLFWLDLYLSGAVEGFAPPAPFTLDELDPAGLLPDRVYHKHELLAYLAHNRQKCHQTVETLTEERVGQPCVFTWGTISFGELLLDNLRHVQEHTAQLNLILGQKAGFNPRWIAQLKE